MDDEFNPDAFKRQSTMLIDPNGTPKFPPRSPSMLESNATPVTYGQTQPGSPQFNQYNQQPQYTQENYGYSNNYAQQASFSPGQVIQPGSFTPQVQPPIGNQTVPQYNSQYDAAGNLVREQSQSSQRQQGSVLLTRSNSIDPNDPAHYVDLSRSSVSPYQAAQYAEISRHLNTAAPMSGNKDKPLPGPPMESIQEVPTPNAGDFPPVPTIQAALEQKHLGLPTNTGAALPESPSPFADPPARPSTDVKTVRSSEEDAQYVTAPPPNQRIKSIPPILPEIRLQSHDSVGPGYYDQFPVSAMGSSFVIPSPSSTDKGFETGPNATEKKPSPLGQAIVTATPVSEKEKNRPETIYSEEDAYGGI